MYEHCLYFNTTSLARDLERKWSDAFRPFSVTPAQGFMLRVILHKKAVTATELALSLNISKATCSRTLGGLIKLGYVEKTQADEDGRSYEIRPTQSAKKIQDTLNGASRDMTRKIIQIIGEQNFDTTVASIRAIGESIK